MSDFVIVKFSVEPEQKAWWESFLNIVKDSEGGRGKPVDDALRQLNENVYDAWHDFEEGEDEGEGVFLDGWSFEDGMFQFDLEISYDQIQLLKDFFSICGVKDFDIIEPD